jgi:hypothetical protein
MKSEISTKSDEITEEYLVKKLSKELELFKRGKNRELSGRPKDKEIHKKQTQKPE